MGRIGGAAAGLAFGLGFAGAAAGQALDATPLHAAGAWAVQHVYDAAEGGAWCAAETQNASGQVFSVVAYDFGMAAVVVFDPAWRLAPRPIGFRIEVDGAPWEVSGEADGTAVSAQLSGADASADAGAAFVAELAAGRDLAVANADGERIAAFSLDGSGAAIEALVECWTLIEPGDPFVAAADPF